MSTIFQARKERVLRYKQPVEPEKIEVPDDLYKQCPSCDKVLHVEEVKINQVVCPNCGYHFRIRAIDRIQYLFDADSFQEFHKMILSKNPLDFPGYEEKIKAIKKNTNLNEAVLTGYARIRGEKIVIAVMDSQFLMGSMGSAVGEKITRAIERATHEKLSLLIFSASGGARMQEGLYSLMQMAKTAAALARHSKAGQFYISILTDPTTGGVSASFAMLGDIIIAEPGALICFAGPRVIEQTINQKLPEGFQTAEFLLEKGFIDIVVSRNKLRTTLAKLVALHSKGGD
ncbi:acetyl-CoA carboxylase beta subunit [Erysipelotrichaceae bacterium]|nr:acetyl-CoA carboxylase beta subunit [Erysipelotrichaceae bacterium]